MVPGAWRMVQPGMLLDGCTWWPLSERHGAARDGVRAMPRAWCQVMEEIDPVNEIEEEFRKTKEKVPALHEYRCLQCGSTLGLQCGSAPSPVC